MKTSCRQQIMVMVILPYFLHRSAPVISMSGLKMFFEMMLSLRLILTQTTGEGDTIMDSTDMSLKVSLTDGLVMTLTARKPDSFILNPGVISEFSWRGGFIFTLSARKSNLVMFNIGMELQNSFFPSSVVALVTGDSNPFMNPTKMIF